MKPSAMLTPGLHRAALTSHEGRLPEGRNGVSSVCRSPTSIDSQYLGMRCTPPETSVVYTIGYGVDKECPYAKVVSSDTIASRIE
jgi:hypothetical protein